MARTLTIDVSVPASDPDKRQTLLGAISMTLMLSGVRIAAGEYEVTITRRPTRRERSRDERAD